MLICSMIFITVAVCEIQLISGDKIYTPSTNNEGRYIDSTWNVYNFTLDYNKHGKPIIVQINNLKTGTFDFNWRMDKKRESRNVDLYKNSEHLTSCRSNDWLPSTLSYKVNSSDILEFHMKCDSLKGGLVQIAFPSDGNNLTSNNNIAVISDEKGSLNSIEKIEYRQVETNKITDLSNNNTFYVNPNVPDPKKHIYPTIQQAINNISDEGTIIVASNSYKEDLLIDRPLSLIGMDMNNTIIGSNGDSISIKSNNVTIRNFTIINGKNGICASEVKSIKISNNIISNCTYDGMKFEDCNDILIIENTLIQSGSHGIYISNGDKFDIKKNRVIISKSDGIGLDGCSNINISKNTIDNSYISGLNLANTNNCLLLNNSLNYNNDTGVYIYNSNNNIITYNEISNNYFGIALSSRSDGNNIFSNKMFKISKCDIELFRAGINNKYQNNLRLCKST